MSEQASQTAWYLHTQQGQQGPFTHEQMRGFIAEGRLGPGSYVWREGFDNWTALGQVDDFEVADRSQSGGADEQAKAQDEYLDGVFTDLVKKSWDRFKRREKSSEVDEVLVGAVISSTLDNGYALIDIESTGQNHYLRFEDTATGNRIIFQLAHQAESLLTSEVLGHEAQVTIGYGERVKNFKAVSRAVKQEMQGGYIHQPDPGVITVDGDISSQYIYVQVGMIWDINDYLEADNAYKVRQEEMTRDIGASLHALRKYLRGRLRMVDAG